MRVLSALLLGLVLLTLVAPVSSASLGAPIHAVDGDLDPDGVDADLAIVPLPRVETMSLDLGISVRQPLNEVPRPRGRTEAPPDRPPTHIT
jgi:hypothetical protein